MYLSFIWFIDLQQDVIKKGASCCRLLDLALFGPWNYESILSISVAVPLLQLSSFCAFAFLGEMQEKSLTKFLAREIFVDSGVAFQFCSRCFLGAVDFWIGCPV